ncbi:unnamed protein product [Euphydryas editha]|uniref:Uncharacterized protein n=1 Tax=Euphydryas editha TaxID=104508 RepID=A0AAU9TQP8_EUPED|nr:unnamed protein product [Euphydryas editha]
MFCLHMIKLLQCQGVQIIPERAKVVYMNEKYFYNFSFNIRRYSRKSGYCINIETTLKRPWNNNVTFNVVFYEFLHNEYRRSFVELHYKYCDFLENEKFIAPILKSYGVKCPVQVGTYRLANMTVPLDNFPDVFPFEKTRMDIDHTCANERMLLIQYYARFKNKVN